eukprot:2475976-Prymnesium_polylepis.1
MVQPACSRSRVMLAPLGPMILFASSFGISCVCSKAAAIFGALVSEVAPKLTVPAARDGSQAAAIPASPARNGSGGARTQN